VLTMGVGQPGGGRGLRHVGAAAKLRKRVGTEIVRNRTRGELRDVLATMSGMGQMLSGEGASGHAWDL
jgi:hypothetical protein